jgi:hypothetical protein
MAVALNFVLPHLKLLAFMLLLEMYETLRCAVRFLTHNLSLWEMYISCSTVCKDIDVFNKQLVSVNIVSNFGVAFSCLIKASHVLTCVQYDRPV